MHSCHLGSKLYVLAGSLLLLIPQLALANPLVGTYELTGRQGRRGTSVELEIEETASGSLKFTRTGKFTGSHFASVPEFTWTKTGLYHGRTAYVLYYVPGSTTSLGMAGALTAGSSSPSGTTSSNVLLATYRLSANGTQLSEKVVNLTHSGSEDWWRTIRTNGGRRQAAYYAGEEATVDNLGNTLTEEQLNTCFTFWGEDTLPHRRFTSYLWNDISSGAMHITDFADDVTVADLRAAIAGPSRRGDPWATRLYAALILEYMQANGISSMRRHDLVRAVKDDFKVKAENAASKNGTETGTDAEALSIEEARQDFSKPLLDLFMYLCGRNPNGNLYGLCPVPLSGDLPPLIAIPNANAVDEKLQVLVQHLGVRKLSIPTLGSVHGPNEWFVKVDLVATGANTLADAQALARQRFSDAGSDYIDYNGSGNTSVFDGVDMLDPAAIAAAVANSFDGEAELSTDANVVREKLLELVPGTDLRSSVEAILQGLNVHQFRFEVLDYGAEVIGDSVIILTPVGGTHSVVIHISYVHA